MKKIFKKFQASAVEAKTKHGGERKVKILNCASHFFAVEESRELSCKLGLLVVKLLSVLLYPTARYFDLRFFPPENVFWDFALFFLSSLQRIDPVTSVMPLEDQEMSPGDEKTSMWM